MQAIHGVSGCVLAVLAMGASALAGHGWCHHHRSYNNVDGGGGNWNYEPTNNGNNGQPPASQKPPTPPAPMADPSASYRGNRNAAAGTVYWRPYVYGAAYYPRGRAITWDYVPTPPTPPTPAPSPIEKDPDVTQELDDFGSKLENVPNLGKELSEIRQRIWDLDQKLDKGFEQIMIELKKRPPVKPATE